MSFSIPSGFILEYNIQREREWKKAESFSTFEREREGGGEERESCHLLTSTQLKPRSG